LCGSYRFQEAVKRKLLDNVGQETVRILLQGYDVRSWRENVVCGETE
jgi:hypothetical protein